MILRKYSDWTSADEQEVRARPAEGEHGTPMRLRLLTMTTLIVTLSVSVMTLLTYLSTTSAVTRAFDQDLDDSATAMIDKVRAADSRLEVIEAVELFRELHPDIQISVQDSSAPREGMGTVTYNYGDAIDGSEQLTPSFSRTSTTVENRGPVRVLTKSYGTGERVVLAMDMREVQGVVGALGSVLLVTAVGGVLVAIAAGAFVSSAGLRPLSRFQSAVDRITATGELRPIRAVGNDELAQLTRSFNTMVKALQESRDRQGRFVADAGHELKTPLTSIRTNIELLLMATRGGKPVDENVRAELERDVTDQMNEMTTLINDLVGLARVESPDYGEDAIDLELLLFACLERIQRRHPDLTFDVESQSWPMIGDSGSLERALTNLLGNAGKWSPPGGTVQVLLDVDDEGGARLVVTDSGPGIPPEDREKVFDRFYRSAEARSMPGSGLGLAIVHQAIAGHSGTVRAEEAATGGAKLVVELPPSLRQEKVSSDIV